MPQFGFRSLQFPGQTLYILFQNELLFWLISAGHLQHGGISGTLFFFQDKRTVGSAKQTIGPRNAVKLIICLLFSRVMHQQESDASLIGKVFQLANDFLITGIAVLITAGFSDFLQSVNDNQPGIFVLRNEAIQLFVKPCTELLGTSCKVEVICALHSEHTE